MRPADVDLIVDELADCPLRGAIRLPNGGGIGLVFDGGRIMQVPHASLLSYDESLDAITNTIRRLTRPNAQLYTIQNLTGPSARDRLETRREVMDKARETGDYSTVDAPSFIGETLADEGRLDARTRDLRERRAQRIIDIEPEV